MEVLNYLGFIKKLSLEGFIWTLGMDKRVFSFQALEKALAAGIFPSSISTDIHVRNIGILILKYGQLLE